MRTLMQWLDKVADECAICQAQRHYDARELASATDKPRHVSGSQICATIGEEKYAGLWKMVMFGALSCCFTCTLPMDWCKQKLEHGQCECVARVLPQPFMAFAKQ